MLQGAGPGGGGAGAPAHLQEEPPTASLQNPALGGAALGRPADMQSQSPCRAAPGAGEPCAGVRPFSGRRGSKAESKRRCWRGPISTPGATDCPSFPSDTVPPLRHTDSLQPLPHTRHPFCRTGARTLPEGLDTARGKGCTTCPSCGGPAGGSSGGGRGLSRVPGTRPPGGSGSDASQKPAAPGPQSPSVARRAGLGGLPSAFSDTGAERCCPPPPRASLPWKRGPHPSSPRREGWGGSPPHWETQVALWPLCACLPTWAVGRTPRATSRRAARPP